MARFRAWVKPWLRRGLLALCGLVAFAGVFLGGRSLLAVAAVDLREKGSAPVLLDRYGGRIVAGPSDLRDPLRLNEISPFLRAAVVAMEDNRFWRHPGIDPIGIVRASLANWRGNGYLQGASTITQQLAKNVFLTPEKTVARKVREAFLAVALEIRYSKEEILEHYLNRVYFGEGAYGAEAAARVYFGKRAADLSLGEAALLAGILPAPNRYSPFRNPQQALARRRLTLERMAALGVIGREEAEEAAETPLVLSGARTGPSSYFAAYVTDRLVEALGPELAFNGGLEVLTTLDPDVQRRAADALAKSGHQGAIVVLDLRSGDILAMVGGRDYQQSQFNRAVNARRQPGSAFKPFIYAAALERHWAPNSLLDDSPRRFGSYAPANWDGRHHGRVTMKYALTHSLNVATVWLLQQIGPRAAVEMASRLGIDSLTDADMHLALALGGMRHGVSPLRLAEAYTPFATGGVLRKARSVLRVVDKGGREWPVPEGRPPVAPRVLSPQVAYLVTDMLRHAVEAGTGTAARIPAPAAGKTGSTNDNRDAWFVGYTPRHLAVVFIGNDDNRPLPGGGGALAAPLWREVMAPLAAEEGEMHFPVPAGIVSGVVVDATTGLLAGPGCGDTHPAAFLRGTEPVRFAPCALEGAGGGEGQDEGPAGPAGRGNSPGEGAAAEGGGHRDGGVDGKDGGAPPGGDPSRLLFFRHLFRLPRLPALPPPADGGPDAGGGPGQETAAPPPPGTKNAHGTDATGVVPAGTEEKEADRETVEEPGTDPPQRSGIQP